ncbi:hypothetical protein CARUB_v10027797mg [Capsella rubella]|uniref:AAA+ ATPase domain-containing protein n=1 Tax=Capsella rubella TaxID=81985 RepID=R0GD11_9BRAS|nr:hypothetical protein CARUB_v10027797mg [Capsella rubella]
MGNSFSVEFPSCDQPFMPFLCGKRKYIHNLEENLGALEKEMQDLNAMRNDLLKRVSKEEEIQGLEQVKEWVSMVEEIEPQANRLLDESVSEIQRLSQYCSLIPASTYRYSEKVLMILKRVKTLRTKGVFEVVIRRALPPLAIKMPPIQLTVSRQNLFERACNLLEDKNVGALGIYGRGGVGKTTLLTGIKNKFRLAAFGLVIFVVVGSEVVESIQEAISNRLGLQWGRETKEDKAAAILMALKGARFLLLLDDIQRGLDLEEIGVPFPSRENGCKIVVTTRSREACDESKWVDAKVEVTCLSPEEAWDLFQETVGDNTLRSHQDIPKLARVVANSCRGLPLALNLIGEAMSHKRTVREWRYTVHVLASSTAEFPDMENGALPILKSIYDNMTNENIRLCFLYCALFPENYDIRKEDLVNYWIGEGILAIEVRAEAENQGYKIIYDLVRMRLLMEVRHGYCVKMPGMVRELALWIASDFGRQIEHFVVVGGEGIHHMPMVNDTGLVRRMSVTSTQIQNISDSLRCSELTTFVCQRNRHLKWISGTFFRWMTGLVVLDLSFNRELAELPEEVSSLVLLRFLNLSWTFIKGLPHGLKELKSLIHLDLDYTSNLQEIDVIASLLNLQVLRLFHSVCMDLKLMEDIQRLKSLKALSLTVRGSSVLQRLLSIHGLASSIQRLHLSTETTIVDGGILSLNAMFSLRELDILGCNIPEIAIDWKSTIQSETVNLSDTEKIPQFQNIRTMTIHGCECLKDLTWLLLAPCLGDLSVSECPQMEEVISKEKAMAKLGHASEQPFQNLTKLVLDGLPKLESIYWTPLPFPVLEYLEIRCCPELRRLPFNSESTIGNQVQMKIEEQLIKVVEWEDDATKQRFSHFNNSDFPQMAEDPKMDGLTSESYPLQNIDQVWTTGSGKKAVQSGLHATSVTMECRTHRVLTPDGPISNMIDTPGKRKVKEMLFNFKDEARLIGISGMIGSGKTILAKELVRDEEVRGHFGNRVLFLTVSQSPNLEKLRALIWDFLIGHEAGFGATIPESIGHTRKLVVLDDVWTRESLDQLMFNIPGTTTLVVSQSKLADPRTTYDVELLHEHEATSLFCLSAFNQNSVPSGFSKSLVKQVVGECKGLPLSLKIIGASLKDRPEKYWESAVERLSRGKPVDETHESKVFAQIEATLEKLDPTSKECFLDMGAFPKGKKIPVDVLINMLVEIHDLEDATAFDVLVNLTNMNLLTLVKDPTYSYTTFYVLVSCSHFYSLNHS